VDAVRKIALIVILGVVMSVSAAGASIFSLDADIYKNSTVELNSFEIAEGETSDQTPGDYIVRTVNEDGESLTSRNFTIQYTVLYNIDLNETSSNTTNRTGQPSDYRRKLLRLPYSYEAESIEILKSGEEIYSLNIPDRICVDDDDTCPEYCQNKGTDSDCEDEQSSSKGFFSKIINFLSIIPGV
jgi:hypothetical protein